MKSINLLPVKLFYEKCYFSIVCFSPQTILGKWVSHLIDKEKRLMSRLHDDSLLRLPQQFRSLHDCFIKAEALWFLWSHHISQIIYLEAKNRGKHLSSCTRIIRVFQARTKDGVSELVQEEKSRVTVGILHAPCSSCATSRAHLWPCLRQGCRIGRAVTFALGILLVASTAAVDHCRGWAPR